MIAPRSRARPPAPLVHPSRRAQGGQLAETVTAGDVRAYTKIIQNPQESQADPADRRLRKAGLAQSEVMVVANVSLNGVGG